MEDWGRLQFSQGLLSLSYIKAKGCAEKEKHKTDPIPVPPYPKIPTIGTAKEKF